MSPWLLILVGALLALDATAVGQFMISRPLPAGILTGILLGDPVVGLAVGGILELYHLPRLPLGGAIVPEGGPSALAAALLAIEGGGMLGILTGTLLGLVLSEMGGFARAGLRRINTRHVPAGGGRGLAPAAVARAHWRGIALDFLRGLVLSAAGVSAALYLAPRLPPTLGVPDTAVAGAIAVAAAIPLGGILRAFTGLPRVAFFFVVGAVLGFAGSWLI